MAVSKFTSSSNANDFNLNIGSTYSAITLTQEYPAGAYSFTSVANDTSMDLYFYNAQGFVAYTNTKGVIASTGFNKIVIIGGTVGDVLSFSYKTTFTTIAETTETNAGPVILSTTPTSLPNVNSSTTVTGLNFATDVVATLTGSDNLVRNVKSLVRGSATSLVITRPDVLPTTYNPYTLTVTNPSISNQPTGSNSNVISVTSGVNPIWVSSSPISSVSGFPLTALSATDADGGSSITYSLISGAYPTGVSSFNSSTGVFTGVPTTAGTYNFTIRATDSGGNFVDKAFTYVISGSAYSDATYYYLLYIANSTFIPPINLTADILSIAGGGAGGRYGGGGGAGGIVYHAAQSLTSGTSYNITVGAGATAYFGDAQGGGQAPSGNPSQFASLQSAYGGGGGGLYQNNSGASSNGANGGSGGGGAVTNGASGTRAAGSTTQVSGGATAYYGNNGGTGVVGTATGAAGGGGAGGVGANGGSGTGGAGGVGTSAYSTWGIATGTGQNVSGTYYYGGGGGGASTGGGSRGPGGYGGGGQGPSTSDGSTTSAIVDGQALTGGGGGGNPDQYVSGVWRTGAGGSGLVMIRYTKASVGG